MLRSRIASTLARSAAAGPSAAPALAVPRLARSVQTTADSSSLIDHGDEHVKVKLHEEYFKAHRCEPPALELEVPKQQLVDIYREMVQCVALPLLSLCDLMLIWMSLVGCAVWRWPLTRYASRVDTTIEPAPPRTHTDLPLIVRSRPPTALQGGPSRSEPRQSRRSVN
jgi:hypothetical protein